MGPEQAGGLRDWEPRQTHAVDDGADYLSAQAQKYIVREKDGGKDGVEGSGAATSADGASRSAGGAFSMVSRQMGKVMIPFFKLGENSRDDVCGEV